MWNLLSEDEKIYFIRNYSGQNAEEITLELVYACEQRLSEKQRTRYVDYISGEIAESRTNALILVVRPRLLSTILI